MTKPSNKRREILSWGILAVFGLSVGNFFGRFIRKKKDETVRLITADGRVVEVPKKHVPRARHDKKVSNKKLMHWMEEGKKALKLKSKSNLDHQNQA